MRGKRFNYVLSTDRRDSGFLFFIDDYQFERFWNDPYPNIERLREFPCALTPDFSLYMDIPMAIKIGMCIALGLLVRRCRMPT